MFELNRKIEFTYSTLMISEKIHIGDENIELAVQIKSIISRAIFLDKRGFNGRTITMYLKRRMYNKSFRRDASFGNQTVRGNEL